MTSFSVLDFAFRCGGKPNQISSDLLATEFSLDSRAVLPTSLFLAIKGARHDGHDFACQALNDGAVAALVERPVEGPHILVDSLVEALAQYALSMRNEFEGPVVGITGSNGKTTCKEFTAAALSFLGPVLKSEGNRNTEYTSPLLWADLRSTDFSPPSDIGLQSARPGSVVVEMAMRGFGQIAHLASFTKPTISVITMIGTAHAEMVGSREGIAKSKAEILRRRDADPTAVLWAEDEFLDYLRSQSPGEVKTFGFTPEADCQIIGYRALSWERCILRAHYLGKSFEAELATVGRHQALNAAAAIVAAHAAGVPIDEAAARLQDAELPPMRMQVLLLARGSDGSWCRKEQSDLPGPAAVATILLDTYNASPDSTVAAIKTLGELPCDGKRYAVIGEMKELGAFSESGHRLVGRALGEAPVEAAMLVGDETRFVRSEAVRAGLAEDQIEQAASLEDVSRFLARLQPSDVALIKGSRALELEKALNFWEVAPQC